MTDTPTKQENQSKTENLASSNPNEQRRGNRNNDRKRNRRGDSKNERDSERSRGLGDVYKRQEKLSSNCSSSSIVGKLLAKRAIKKGVKQVIFDRGGNLYHGRVKALADAARDAGLNF